MAGDAIWATALFLPLMTLVLGTLGPLRRAVTLWGDSHGKSAAEREAKAALDVANADEKRHSTDVHRRAIDAEVAMEVARLGAETAQYETDAEAARHCLPAAVEARHRALEARAEAEAALAPDVARMAMEADRGETVAALCATYERYCARMTYSTDILPFGEWARGFEGASRG